MSVKEIRIWNEKIWVRRHNDFVGQRRLHGDENADYIHEEDFSEFTPEQEQLAEKAMAQAFERMSRGK